MPGWGSGLRASLCSAPCRPRRKPRTARPHGGGRSRRANPMDAPALTLARIDKSFSGVRVLKDVSLTVSRRGSILGLVGENGAGKSTLMNILGGVLHRDAGEMLLEGKPYDPRSAVDADQ